MTRTDIESQETLLQAVRECAELAGAFALKHYRRDVAIEELTLVYESIDRS